MSLESNISNKSPKEVIEIGLADIVRFLLKYYIWLILVPLIFGAIGYAISYLYPKTYKATTTLLPEYNMSSSAFSYALASNSAQGAENLVPDLYPTVLQSTPFGIYLLKQPVLDQTNKLFPTLNKYLNGKDAKEITPTNTTVLKIPDSEIFNLSPLEQERAQSAAGLVKVIIDKKNSVISIESEMLDPMVAAVLVEAGKKYLINYVEDYRTGKVLGQIGFLTKELTNAKKRRQSAEYALQSYRDSNRNPFLNTARIEEQRLISEFAIAQSVYDQLVQRQEQAKIKLKEEKPVFKVLEPTKVPLSKSSPKRSLFAIVAAGIGVLLTFLFILFVIEKIQKRFLSIILKD